MTESPDDLVPDSKDWTWVLERTCAECGFDATAHDRSYTAAMIRGNGDQWCEALNRPDVAQRARPDLWSTLEYACHVRDVYRVYETRVSRMLGEDDPFYDNWDQDATAISDAYATQDPSTVAQELHEAAARIAAVFDTVTTDAQWLRTGRRGDGSHFTVESISRYMLHDTIHHLVDVDPVVSQAGGDLSE